MLNAERNGAAAEPVPGPNMKRQGAEIWAATVVIEEGESAAARPVDRLAGGRRVSIAWRANGKVDHQIANFVFQRCRSARIWPIRG